MTNNDNVVRAGNWEDRSTDQARKAASGDPQPRSAPASAGETLAEDAAQHGGPFEPALADRGAFGRTLFDHRSSEDGTITVVFPDDHLGDIPSQALIRVASKPDGHEYIASVTAGPFCEPDGLEANAPQLIVTAVRGHETLPRNHGRLLATILGEKTSKGIIPASHRPRPNAAVHLVESTAVSDILNLNGDIRLGLLSGHDDVEVRTDSRLKSVLPRHTAHIGTTGGGKSTGVGRVLHQFQTAGVCAVVFDVEGEYTNLDKPNDNPGILGVLDQRGLEAEAIKNTHVYRLRGCAAANPRHPSSTEFTLQFNQISPHTFGEIMDLTDPQNDRLFQAYEIARYMLRDLDIFPKKNNPSHDAMIRDINEFERGWPCMQLEDLRYVIGGILAVYDKTDTEEPAYRLSQFHGNWQRVRTRILQVFGGGDDDGKKRASISSPQSWKALMGKVSRLTRLKVFDQGQAFALDYAIMLAPGRINIIDLSDLENMDVRNLAIAEMLRGILARQQELYDAGAKQRDQGLDAQQLVTNVIIEEAHEFLSAKRVTRMPTLREQLMTIAKRGRKRYLGLTFVTQSPNDLPDDVLGLVNNWIVYKIDEATIRRLKSYIPNSDDSLWTPVRSLGPGQALVSFTNMRRPVIGSIDPSPARLMMTD